MYTLILIPFGIFILLLPIGKKSPTLEILITKTYFALTIAILLHLSLNDKHLLAVFYTYSLIAEAIFIFINAKICNLQQQLNNAHPYTIGIAMVISATVMGAFWPLTRTSFILRASSN